MWGDIVMKQEAGNINLNDLRLEVERKLLEYNLISFNDKISLCPIHNVIIHGKYFSHYIITCVYSSKTFFLKTVKENDNFLLCDRFLKNINDEGLYYPRIIVPRFTFQGMQYYIITYIEGRPLDMFSEALPQSTLYDIADKLLFLIEQLALINASQYSENAVFVPDDCIVILKQKLANRMRHPLIAGYPPKKVERTFHWCCNILEHSQFSRPTLIHMDVKPANIIYNEKTGSVSLIDFEFARFGDFDYGWTQILLSGCNHFNPFYKKHIVPHLTKGRITLDDAFDIPKFQCYLYYQAMCNLIYYYDRHLPCPKEIEEIFNAFIARM